MPALSNSWSVSRAGKTTPDDSTNISVRHLRSPSPLLIPKFYDYVLASCYLDWWGFLKTTFAYYTGLDGNFIYDVPYFVRANSQCFKFPFNIFASSCPWRDYRTNAYERYILCPSLHLAEQIVQSRYIISLQFSYPSDALKDNGLCVTGIMTLSTRSTELHSIYRW